MKIKIISQFIFAPLRKAKKKSLEKKFPEKVQKFHTKKFCGKKSFY